MLLVFLEADMKLKIKKRDLLLLVPIIAISIYFLYNTSWSEAIGKDWQPCLDIFAQGKLYQGQLICPYGPVYFGIGYLFRLVFNDFYQIALRIFLLTLFIFTIYFLVKISQKETTKKHFLIIIFLSLLWIYPQTVSAKPEKAFALLFTFFGFYTLYYTNYKFKEIVSAALFSLAMYSSFNAAPVIFIIVGMYFFKLEIANINFKRPFLHLNYEKEKIKKYLTLIFSLALLFLFIKLLYPNFLVYSLYAHSQIDIIHLSLGSVLIDMLPTFYMPVLLLLLYIIFILCLLTFIKTKHHAPVICFFGLILIVMSIKLNLGDFQFGRMTAPIVPFLILTITLAINFIEKKTYQRLALNAFIFFLIIFPGYEQNPINSRIYNFSNISLRELQKEIGYGVHFLPQNKKVMAQYPELLSKYNYKSDDIEIVEGTVGFYTPVDLFSGAGLVKLGVANQSSWYENAPSELKNEELQQKMPIILSTKEKLRTGKYDIIIWHEENDDTIIEYAINELKKEGLDIKRFYMPIVLPNLDQTAVYSVHASRVLFKDVRDLGRISTSVGSYYQGIFDHVCQKSKFLAETVIKQLLMSNTLITNTGQEIPLGIGKSCQSGGNLYKSFDNYVLFNEHLLILLSVIILSMVMYIKPLKQNQKLNTRNEKLIYFGIIIICILLFFYLTYSLVYDYKYYLNILR